MARLLIQQQVLQLANELLVPDCDLVTGQQDCGPIISFEILDFVQSVSQVVDIHAV